MTAIEIRRKKLGLTQTELAQMVEQKQPVISDIENGSPAHDRLAKDIAMALGVPVLKLFSRKQKPAQYLYTAK